MFLYVSRYKPWKSVLSLQAKSLSSVSPLLRPEATLSQSIAGNKSLFGPKALVITKFDESHQFAAQQIAFELRNVGVQALSFHVHTQFPTIDAIVEAKDLIQRTGSSSLITFGNASITDFGKATRDYCSKGSLTVNSSINEKSMYPPLPLFSIATTTTVSHWLPSFQYLHQQDDILVAIPSSPPNVVCCDPKFQQLAPHLTQDIAQVAFITTLFDQLFAFTQFNHIATLQQFQLSSRSEIISATETVAKQYQTLSQLPISLPLLLQDCVMLLQTSCELPRQFPHSYLLTCALHAMLTEVLPRRHRYVSKTDQAILQAVDMVLLQLQFTLNLDVAGLEKQVRVTLKDMQTIIKQQPKLFPLLPPSKNALSVGGILEKLLIHLDFLVEQDEQKLWSEQLIVRKKIMKGVIAFDLMEGIMNIVQEELS